MLSSRSPGTEVQHTGFSAGTEQSQHCDSPPYPPAPQPALPRSYLHVWVCRAFPKLSRSTADWLDPPPRCQTHTDPLSPGKLCHLLLTILALKHPVSQFPSLFNPMAFYPLAAPEAQQNATRQGAILQLWRSSFCFSISICKFKIALRLRSSPYINTRRKATATGNELAPVHSARARVPWPALVLYPEGVFKALL